MATEEHPRQIQSLAALARLIEEELHVGHSRARSEHEGATLAAHEVREFVGQRRRRRRQRKARELERLWPVRGGLGVPARKEAEVSADDAIDNLHPFDWSEAELRSKPVDAGHEQRPTIPRCVEVREKVLAEGGCQRPLQLLAMRPGWTEQRTDPVGRQVDAVDWQAVFFADRVGRTVVARVDDDERLTSGHLLAEICEA